MGPNECAVIQFLHRVLRPAKFKGSVLIFPNHRLYREDKAFLYPSLEYELNQLSKRSGNLILPNRYDKLKMSYYHGKLLSNLTVHCARCDTERDEIQVNRNKYYNLEINFPRVSEAMLVTSKAIEYAQGEYFLYNVTPSFDFDPEHYGKSGNPYIDRIWFDSKSWVSSTIYHINCSKSLVDNSNWSNLPTSTISRICKLDIRGHFVSSNKNINYLEPPIGLKDDYWGHRYPSVWTLKLSIEKSGQFKETDWAMLCFPLILIDFVMRLKSKKRKDVIGQSLLASPSMFLVQF